jgi:formate dehydrogenase maturation protein FdhE
MAKKLLGAIFGSDDDDDPASKPAAGGDASPASEPGTQPRSIPDAWARLAEENRKVEERLAALEALQKQLLESTNALHETAKQQLQVLNYLGRFSEAAERRGREMQQQMQGVPDVLRTLPSATKEQAEKLSEIAARLYEKARDDTVNALKAAQAAHQKSIEDLIDKSLGQSRSMTWAAMALAGLTAILAAWMWFKSG